MKVQQFFIRHISFPVAATRVSHTDTAPSPRSPPASPAKETITAHPRCAAKAIAKANMTNTTNSRYKSQLGLCILQLLGSLSVLLSHLVLLQSSFFILVLECLFYAILLNCLFFIFILMGISDCKEENSTQSEDTQHLHLEREAQEKSGELAGDPITEFFFIQTEATVINYIHTDETY